VYTFNPHGTYTRKTSDWFAFGYTALALLFGPAQGMLMAKRARWFAASGWVESMSQRACEGEADPGEQASEEEAGGKGQASAGLAYTTAPLAMRLL
jgi:hypothetical protein